MIEIELGEGSSLKLISEEGMGSEDKWKPEKKWKMVYLRSEKLARAKQLGFEYPRKNIRQTLDSEPSGNE